MKILLEKPEYLKLDELDLPDEYPFPYHPEKFTKEEKIVLSRFFTNHNKPVFAIFGLPQEVVGAMFSRYSRTAKSVRRVFLDEFWKSEDLGIQKLGSKNSTREDFEKARERTKNFYRRVFAEYGDDSVIQMGSVHIAFEYVSQIAIKAIEDQRVASAYIEKSTRYVDFSNKVSGRFLFADVFEIKDTPYEKDFLKWNNCAYRSYVKSLPIARKYFRKKFPLEEYTFVDSVTGESVFYKDISDVKGKERARRAYERALRARSFDSIRLFLPLTMVSNLGAHYSGQAVEHTINKMLSSPYQEVRLVGAMAYEELKKVASNFLQNVDHKYGNLMRNYLAGVRKRNEELSSEWIERVREKNRVSISLVDWDDDADVKIASQIIFKNQPRGNISKKSVFEWAKKIKEKEVKNKKSFKWSPTLVNIITDSVSDRRSPKKNRRHKLSRPFEHSYAEVDFNTDFGVYKDLQRNRLSSTDRPVYSSEKLFIPPEYKDKGMKSVLNDYKKLEKLTKTLRRKLIKSSNPKLIRAVEYITLHGSMVHFSIRANIRQWAFFSELRTIEGGHPSYRRAMQKAIKEIAKEIPWVKELFVHVNWTKDYGLGRLKAEVKTQEKLSSINNTDL